MYARARKFAESMHKTILFCYSCARRENGRISVQIHVMEIKRLCRCKRVKKISREDKKKRRIKLTHDCKVKSARAEGNPIQAKNCFSVETLLYIFLSLNHTLCGYLVEIFRLGSI